MNKLSFWHRVAFIANVCWLLTWGIKYYSFIPAGDVQSHIVVTGLVIANLANVTVNIITGILLSIRKLPAGTPRWLMIANFLFLLPQLYLFFK